eukprot:tig00020996_g16961.t1
MKPVLWPSCRCHHLPLRRSPTKLLFNKVSQERVYLVHVAVVRYEKSQMVTANDRILQLSSFKSTEKSIKSVVHLLMHRISPRKMLLTDGARVYRLVQVAKSLRVRHKEWLHTKAVLRPKSGKQAK